MQTTEDARSLETVPVGEAQSLEEVSHFHYQPITCPIASQAEQEAFAQEPEEEAIKVREFVDFQFDIRQAVIASEILNRKY